MKVHTFGKVAAAGFGAALAVVMAATPAAADPSPATDYRVLAGVGSDTTQDVMNGLGNVITSGGGKVVASWDARGTDTIKVKSAGCTLNRPNGSGNGRRALRASGGENLGGTNGGPGFYEGADIRNCVDYARSSSYGGGSTPSSTGNYTYIPFGVDAVSLAVNQNGDLPFNMSFAQIQRVYKCFDTTIAGNPVQPRTIQAGSGTWEFWMSKMQINETEIGLGDYPCLTGLPRTQEHDGSALTGNLTHVVPFSSGQFVAQSNVTAIANLTGVPVTDRRGAARLVGISMPGQSVQQPLVGGTTNPSFGLRRDVYNVVPTAKLTDPTIAATFVGANSAVCTATVNDGGTNRNVVQLFGFGLRTTTLDDLNAACGYTNLRFNS
ncbi:hypothetical protein AB0M79_14270 [Polymorphospora sp. NPDC051019]|uniref:hypothetical protein n=1 Tax=Polymorphospora sp. NPDC051019 TaxID=3155725 RepID=UPI003435339E